MMGDSHHQYPPLRNVIVTTWPLSSRTPLSSSGTWTLGLILVGLLFNFEVCSVVGDSLNCSHAAANGGEGYSGEGSHLMGKSFPKVSISSLVVGNGDGGNEGSAAVKWNTELPYNASTNVLEVPGDEPLDTLEFLCSSAEYPVLWGFRKYQAWIPWTVTTGRELVTSSVDGAEKITQVFKSWLKYGSIRNITQLRSDFPTCYKAGDKCMQSSISVEKDKEGKFNLVAHKGSEYDLDAHAEFGGNINCSIRMGFDKATSTFYCQSMIPGSNVTMWPRTCSDVVACSSVYQSSEKPCLEEPMIPLGDCNTMNRCAKLNYGTVYLPQIAICSIRGIKDATAALPFFYGLPQRGNPRPSLYLNWNEAVPEDMMQISSLEGPFYVGQKFEVVCNASYYYFGSGMLFEVKEHPPINYTFANGSSVRKYTLASTALVDEDSSYYTINPDPVNVIKKIINPNNSETVFSESATVRGVELKVPKVRTLRFSSFFVDSPGTYDIVCKAPMWNSTGWGSKTVTINVLNSVKPTFSSGNKTETLYYEANNKLSCVAHGIPQPVVEWNLDGHTLPPGIKTYVGSENSTLSWNNLQFPNSNTGIYGNFTCSASNPAGLDEKTFIVIPKDKDSFTAVLVIALLGVLGMILIPAVVFLFWKVKQQTRQIKYLTTEEVEEFLLGKADFVPFECDMGTYAYYLPYDTAFEIPKENLHIDFNRILGSGAYGMVIFGQYNNPASHGKVQDVAIKTSKPLDDGIEFFKALLSELKIMTYIGKHENIINLIGACTSNIQKREVYIALEYCENGSLVSYLRTNRHFFLNAGFQSNRSGGNGKQQISRQPSFLEKAHVQYVKMDDLTNISIAKPQDYGNTNSLTILDLFRWSHDIAEGMAFLASKKVIHGDLAARNTLLTGDLTAKIGDFGLSKRLMNYDSYARTASTPLPIKWMAIECLQDFKFSAESDIWSYGITLWELFSLGEVPYAGWNGTGDEFLKCLSRGMRLAQPIFCPPEVFEVVVSCWRNDRKMRPSFEDLSQYFIKKMNTFNLNDFHPALISTDSNPDLNYVTTKSNASLVDEE